MVKIHSYNFKKPTPKNKKSTLMVKIHSHKSKFNEPLLEIKNQLQMVKTLEKNQKLKFIIINSKTHFWKYEINSIEQYGLNKLTIQSWN